MRANLAKSLWALLFLFVHLQLNARQQPGTDTVLQRYGIVTDSGTVSANRNKSGFYLVRFRVFPGQSVLQQHGSRKALSALHYILQQPVTDTALLRNVVYTYAANSNWKSSTSLLQQLDKLKDKDSITLQASIDPSLAPPGWCYVRRQPSRSIAIVTVRKHDWPQFIAQAAVRFADRLRQARTETIVSNNDMSLNRISTVQQLYPQLRGNQMTVSIKENLFDTADADLQGRYRPSGISSGTLDAHATIMATLIAGGGNTGPEGKGVATAAWLSSSDFNSTANDNKLLPDDPASYQQLGIRLQNHSYGTGIENYYGIEAAAYDEQAQELDTLLHVFSSGNDGNLTPSSGAYNGIAGLANLSGTYKHAKNVLVAGATNGVNGILALSSKGPAYDGRVKPELVAYGVDGTSNAAALTSGIATLVQDAYIQQLGSAPAATLLKTVLINSADDTGDPHVDYSSGYGAVNALKAVKTITENRFFSGNATNGSSQVFPITVPAGSGQLKVTLGWNDPAAAADAPKALVNDLDLWVEDAGGNRYDPWVLSSFPAADSLRAVARRGRDTLNNTEQVTIDNPSGVVRIHINGRAVSSASQRFFVAYEFTPAAYFSWEYPAPQSMLNANTTAPLRWSTAYTGAGTLQYSLDSSTWQPLVQDIPLESGSLNWTVPEVFSKAWLRMQTANGAFTSAAFSISAMPQPQVGFNCPDSVLLYWPSLPGAAAYEVYVLNGAYLGTFTRTTDTFIVIQKQGISGTWLAVSGVHADGWAGVKSYSLDYENQGVSCYVATLLADAENDAAVRLTLNLGSLYNLRTIWWETLGVNGFNTLQSTPVDGNTSYTIVDNTPHSGMNYYRVRLETSDGRMILSDTVFAAIVGAGNTYVMFPNPVTNNLQLLTKAAQERNMQIFDISGRLVRSYLLTNMQESIDISGLTPGVYVVAIYEEGKRVFVQKVVKAGN
ncbi:S8/S53 family peptidase [uncultured Chitinophaga sp.]|jgi:hypothetical protein|uniref:S8/S53 family peptidase n=1 Tax=uncultured Chitinophaga sp. TaxID=339340 RepID=UPI002625A581|nr:S8/S53 family peptidase [uncultured Chitinophaga sp.]